MKVSVHGGALFATKFVLGNFSPNKRTSVVSQRANERTNQPNLKRIARPQPTNNVCRSRLPTHPMAAYGVLVREMVIEKKIDAHTYRMRLDLLASISVT